MEPERRLEVARKIVSAAGDHGIPPEDVVIDPLAMPVGAEPRAVTLFIETVRLIREHLGVNMTCGASNTSFGLPGRHVLSATFLAICESHGLTSAIMDARSPQCVEAVRAADLLLGHDEWGASLDRGPPGKAGGRGLVSSRGRRRRHWPRPADLQAGGRRGARPSGDDGVRRRQLERHRHRLDLRRPRHVPQVQGQGAGRRRCRSTGSTRAPSSPTSCATAGGWPAGRSPATTCRSRCRRCRRGPRRRWSASAATSSSARPCRSATWSWRSRRWRTRRPTWSGCWPHRRPRAAGRAGGRAAGSAGCCARRTSR